MVSRVPSPLEEAEREEVGHGEDDTRWLRRTRRSSLQKR